LESVVHEGSVVHVPLQKRKESALVTALFATLQEPVAFRIKEISSLGQFPNDTHYHNFIQKLARFYFLKPLYFYQRIRHFLKEEQVDGDQDILVAKEYGKPDNPQALVTLTK